MKFTINSRQIKLFIHEDDQFRSFRFISYEMKDEIDKGVAKLR